MKKLLKTIKHKAAVLCLCGFAVAASSAFASEMVAVNRYASGRPIEITSRQLKADGVLRKVTFLGDVEARQGDVVLYGPELILFYAKENQEVERMEAPAGLRIVQGARTATGEHGLFLTKEEKVILTGSAKVTKGESYLEGDEIIYFLNGDTSWCKSREGGQVKAVFFPKKEKE